MIDRFTAMSWLEGLAQDDWRECHSDSEVQEIARQTLSLLKEHETADTGKARIFQCEKCGYGVDDIYLTNEHDFDIYPHFCPNCGRVVKQEAKTTPTAGTNEIPLKW